MVYLSSHKGVFELRIRILFFPKTKYISDME